MTAYWKHGHPLPAMGYVLMKEVGASLPRRGIVISLEIACHTWAYLVWGRSVWI